MHCMLSLQQKIPTWNSLIRYFYFYPRTTFCWNTLNLIGNQFMRYKFLFCFHLWFISRWRSTFNGTWKWAVYCISRKNLMWCACLFFAEFFVLFFFLNDRARIFITYLLKICMLYVLSITYPILAFRAIKKDRKR